MAIPEILKYPDPILRKKSKLVNSVREHEKILIDELIQTMKKNQGVGLSAPQVGILKRIIVIEAMEEFKEPFGLINPRITKRKGRTAFCEGCLSLPDIESEVTRSKEVRVEALDRNGKGIFIDAKDLVARVIQHEIDHLDGILFIDKVGFLKRTKLLKRFKANGQVCV